MARQSGYVSVFCECPLCVTSAGFDRMRAQMDSTAVTVGTLMDLLERHFPSSDLMGMRLRGLTIMDALADAYDASELLQHRVKRSVRGKCMTRGVPMLKPTTPRPPSRLN